MNSQSRNPKPRQDTSLGIGLSELGKKSKRLDPFPVLTMRELFLEGEQIFTNLLPYFKLQLEVCNLIVSVPYEWDAKVGRIRVLRSKYRLLYCKGQVVVHCCYTLIMLGYFITPGSMGLNSSSSKMLGLVFLVCFVATTLMRITFWRKQDEGALLVNSFLDFEEKFLPASKGKKSVDKIAKLMIIIGLATSFGLPGFMSTMILKDPCKPPHLGYILFKESVTRCATPGHLIRLAILGFDTWMWANAIAPSCFFVFNIFCLGLKCLDLYVKLLVRGMCHPLTKKFRSQEQKNQICFKLYRHLQLLVNLYNTVLKRVFIPSQVAAACSVLIIGLYTCIKLHKVIPMPGFAFFPLISLDGLTVIFITKVGAGVLQHSKMFIRMVQRSGKQGRRTWFRKMASSCNFIKILCSSSYFDNLTPLICINFCLVQTVSLTLLS